MHVTEVWFVPGSATTPSVTIKVFIEQDQMFPVWVGAIHICLSVTGPLAIFVRQEKVGDSATQVLGDMQQVGLVSRSSWVIHFQIVSIEIIVALQTLDDQEINWEDQDGVSKAANKDLDKRN